MFSNLTVDTGLKDLPFPMRVSSRENPEGQWTVAAISVSARVRRKQEGDWIQQILRILHAHRDRIGASTLRGNIMDYLLHLEAEMVRVDFRYPFFYEKRTPKSREKCLLCYPCTYSAKVPSIEEAPRIFLKMEIPVLTSFPMPEAAATLPPPVQQSRIIIETESKKDIFPEDLVDLADRHALSPVYTFLTGEDLAFLAARFRNSRKSIEETIEGINHELALNHDIGWHSIRCSNKGLLYSYETEMSADKKMLSPFELCQAFEV
jgi:GTP cyclohydrolase I